MCFTKTTHHVFSKTTHHMSNCVLSLYKWTLWMHPLVLWWNM